MGLCCFCASCNCHILVNMMMVIITVMSVNIDYVCYSLSDDFDV